MTNNNGSSSNLLSYAPDCHQCQNAVYWRTKGIVARHVDIVTDSMTSSECTEDGPAQHLHSAFCTGSSMETYHFSIHAII